MVADSAVSPAQGGVVGSSAAGDPARKALVRCSRDGDVSVRGDGSDTRAPGVRRVSASRGADVNSV